MIDSQKIYNKIYKYIVLKQYMNMNGKFSNSYLSLLATLIKVSL